MVSRKWLATLTSAEETSTQVEACFLAALDAEDLLTLADERATAALREAIASGERDQAHGLASDGQIPLLLAISDTGPQMRSVSTREFLAGVAIAQQFGRPHTPQDQAWIETLFATSRASGRTWRRSATPASSTPSWTTSRPSTTPSGCTHPSATSPPATSTKAEVMPSAKPAATGSPAHARTASHTVEAQPLRRTSDRAPPLAGYFNPRLVH